MRKIFVVLSVACAVAIQGYGQDIDKQPLQATLDAYRPAHTAYASPQVESVSVNKGKKTIEVVCSESTAYIPLTKAQIEQLKADFRSSLPEALKKYKIVVKVGERTIDELATDAKRVKVGPKEKAQFVKRIDGVSAPLGLEGANIAVWQSHGWYFSQKLNRWEWQRAKLFGTVEDLYTQSYVMPFLMPMLENAGAYVMSPRERDTRVEEILIDNDDRASAYAEVNGKNAWGAAPKAGFAYDGHALREGENPFAAGTARIAKTVNKAADASEAQWSAPIPEDGAYAVYVSYQSLPNSVEEAMYTVHTSAGPKHVAVNQKMGGGTWIYLGHFPFMKGDGSQPLVTLTNYTAGKGSTVTADAVKIGGGMGNVARGNKPDDKGIDYTWRTSGAPRYIEGSRYFLQYAGAPDSVYNESAGTNDYTDDYRSRGRWVNWLAGGSSMMPKAEGLGIPVDLSLAFHTDAGTTPNDSVIGTLGIYATDKTERYPNGASRIVARDYTNSVMTNITNDIRATFAPDWTRRGMWDQNYAEARAPQVPAMLLELLSHQNFGDMKYGLDPAFRFVVSRAIYKGMLKFIADRDGRAYVVQPLPVQSFAIAWTSPFTYKLTWQPTDDKLEPTAAPTYYIVQERISPSNGFATMKVTHSPEVEINVADDGAIHSYRIIACNDGGASFPSETLALYPSASQPEVLIVNAFTRVSGPDTFDYGEIAGFDFDKDFGVAYIQDIGFIGAQREFNRSLAWIDDDVAGFGSSRSDYARKVIAGNTFDYVALHGEAVVEASKALGKPASFVSASAAAFAAGSVANEPKIVDIIMGKQKEVMTGAGAYGSRFKAYPAELQAKLREYTADGGNVLVTGAYIGTDIWNNPYADTRTAIADQEFVREVLGYQWKIGGATVAGEVREVDNPFKSFKGGEYKFVNALNEDAYMVESPDALAPSVDGSAVIMQYTENNLNAGVAFDAGKYRTVALGFPFEAVEGAHNRTNLMQQILKFLLQ